MTQLFEDAIDSLTEIDAMVEVAAKDKNETIENIYELIDFDPVNFLNSYLHSKTNYRIPVRTSKGMIYAEVNMESELEEYKKEVLNNLTNYADTNKIKLTEKDKGYFPRSIFSPITNNMGEGKKRIMNNMKKLGSYILIGLIASVAIMGSGCIESNDDLLEKSVENYIENDSLAADLSEYDISSGWTITSYQDINENLYEDPKIEVFDSYGNSLGSYKSDFIKQIKIDGSGKGDNIDNSGQYLHYDYGIDDGETCYLVNKSLGAYNNKLVPWIDNNPSLAVNPPLPQGTQIKFINLGLDSEHNPEWVNELLKTKTFYADDKFYGFAKDEKNIDVYVGLQKSRDYGPESLLMRNVTLGIKYPD